MEKEIWKDIKGYEGYYQVSNLGRVKSLERKYWNVVNKTYSTFKEKIMKQSLDTNGYKIISAQKNRRKRTRTVHQLVAEAFLGHIPCGMKLVVNHINFIKTDNRVENLEIVTVRENSNLKHIKSRSKYVGVTMHEPCQKWCARIVINKKRRHLGYFEKEIDAHLAYQEALNNHLNI